MNIFYRSRSVILIMLYFLSSSICIISAQTLEERINAILGKMTIDEKIKQLHQEGGFNTADNTRLNIPGFIMADGPHGVRDGNATCFPVGISMAATWDPELAERIGIAMGKEFRGKGKHQALGPAMDLNRDPRNGRSAESGGEDPYLDAIITTAVTKGIQTTPCLATIKHYNANHRENDRYNNNITTTQRMLMEYYGLYFRTAVQQGGAFSVMNAYNLINGEKCAENRNLLTTILREKWGFPYYVVSDWNSIYNSEKAIKAGCDICMGSEYYQRDLPSLVSSGKVPVSAIDEAVRHVLRTKTVSGMMDYYPKGDPTDVNCKEHQQLAYEAGKKALILLKNQDDILPLNSSKINTIALIGPSAGVAQIDGGGSAYVSPFYTVSPKDGLITKIGSSRVLYAKGCDINSANVDSFAYAKQLAAKADVVIFCGGLDPSQESEGMDRIGGSINLPGKQQDLINELASVNKNVIVTIFSGGICGLNRCIDNIKGLIYAFYPGQEGGNALADVIFGDYNPGGKLPVTIPKLDSQLPTWDDNFFAYNTSPSDDWGGGYRWYDARAITPQFAFGYGLSYTTFAYSNINVTPSTAAYGQPVQVSIDVTNTGSRAGDEVVQLYLKEKESSFVMPIKQLKGFKRITLNPGEKQTVTFMLTNDELYYFNDTDSTFEVDPGMYTILAGGSSDNLPLSTDFQILSGEKKPDLLITGIRTVPRYPIKGQKVQFLATVKNQGTGESLAGTKIKVLFKVDGKDVSWLDDYEKSIPAGGMALVCANSGPSGTYEWNADNSGTFNIEGTVDYDNSVKECVEDNNTYTTQISVITEPPKNLAISKSVTVTSIEGTGLEGAKAVDGNLGTRWSSAFSDPQSITVDLGAVIPISKILITWEAAFAKEYYIQVSDDGASWKTVRHETNGQGGVDQTLLAENARYVRMNGIQRTVINGTKYGYSIYELEVYGSSTTDIKKDDKPAVSYSYKLKDNYPNPFNPTTTISYEVAEHGSVKIEIYNLLGQLVNTLVNSEHSPGSYSVQWNGKDNFGHNVASGIYLYKMEAGKFSQSKKLIMLK